MAASDWKDLQRSKRSEDKKATKDSIMECPYCKSTFQKDHVRTRMKKWGKDKQSFYSTKHCPNCDKRILLRDDNPDIESVNTRLSKLRTYCNYCKMNGQFDEYRDAMSEILELQKQIEDMRNGEMSTKDAKNFMGERVFQTYEAWKRACRQIDPNVKFDGDIDICQAGKVGEWDGDKGIIYNTKDSKTKDEVFSGKDQYKIKIYKVGAGYNWEVFDPQGRKSISGLQAVSMESAKKDADRKLGMQIFSTLDSKKLMKDAASVALKKLGQVKKQVKDAFKGEMGGNFDLTSAGLPSVSQEFENGYQAARSGKRKEPGASNKWLEGYDGYFELKRRGLISDKKTKDDFPVGAKVKYVGKYADPALTNARATIVGAGNDKGVGGGNMVRIRFDNGREAIVPYMDVEHTNDSKKTKDVIPSPKDTYNKIRNFDKIALQGFARRIGYPELSDLKKMDTSSIIAELISFLHGEKGDQFLENPNNFKDSKPTTKDWLDPQAKPLSDKVVIKMKEIYKRTKEDNIYDLFSDATQALGISGKIKEDVRILTLQGANYRYTEQFVFTDSKPTAKDKLLKGLDSLKRRVKDAFGMNTEEQQKEFDTRNIEEETIKNNAFRRVVFTGNTLQLALMSLLPNEDIGMEVHDNVDQFFRIEKGEGLLEIEGQGSQPVKDGFSILITAGTKHNVKNIGSEPLKLYTIYGPPNHPADRLQNTKAEAVKEEEESKKVIGDKKTKDKIFTVSAVIKTQNQKKKVIKPVNADSPESAKKSFESFLKNIDPSTEIIGMTTDSKKTKDIMAVGEIKNIDYKGYQIQLRRFENAIGWKVLKDGSLVTNGQSFYSESSAIESAKKDIDSLTKDKKTKDADYYAIVNKKTGQVLSTANSEAEAKDELNGITVSNRNEYIIKKTNTPPKEWSMKDSKKTKDINPPSESERIKNDFESGRRDHNSGYYDKWYRWNRKDNGRAYDDGFNSVAGKPVQIIEAMHDSKKTKDQENYKVYWVNHNYYSQEEFNTLEEARKYADSKSFEYRIDLNGRPVASGGSLRGFRMIDKKMKDDDSIEVLRAKALKKALADFYKDIKEVDSPSTIAGAQALTKSINLETDVNKLRRIVGDAKTKDAKTYTIRSDETNKQIYRALLRAGFKEHKDFAWIIDEALPDKLEIYNPKAQTIVEDYI